MSAFDSESPAPQGFFHTPKALQMLKDLRCGKCARLLARASGLTELQIKCSRCATLNHVKATSLERSPVSDMNAENPATHHPTQ